MKFVFDYKTRLIHNGYVLYLLETDVNSVIVRDEHGIFVAGKEVEELETGKKERVAVAPPPYLDPKNPHYSPKLAAAIDAWLAAYGGGRPTRKQGHKKPIVAWLEAHRKDYGGLSNQAVEQIATIVNANPNGGAPPQDLEYIWKGEQNRPTHYDD